MAYDRWMYRVTSLDEWHRSLNGCNDRSMNVIHRSMTSLDKIPLAVGLKINNFETNG